MFSVFEVKPTGRDLLLIRNKFQNGKSKNSDLSL
jgi:hypothetical protein